MQWIGANRGLSRSGHRVKRGQSEARWRRQARSKVEIATKSGMSEKHAAMESAVSRRKGLGKGKMEIENARVLGSGRRDETRGNCNCQPGYGSILHVDGPAAWQSSALQCPLSLRIPRIPRQGWENSRGGPPGPPISGAQGQSGSVRVSQGASMARMRSIEARRQ